MTREQLVDIWKKAFHIHTQSRLGDVRRAARTIAIYIEDEIGQVEPRSARDWSETSR